MGLSFADAGIGSGWARMPRSAARSLRFWRKLEQGGLCDQWRKRNIQLSDLLERLVDFDGLGWPSRMHDEHDGPGAAAARIAAIAFADADYGFVIGVDDGPGMFFQLKRSVASPIGGFSWEEKSGHVHPSA